MFNHLNTHANDVLTNLILSQDLCKYIHYESVETELSDPIGMPDLSIDERKTLMYSRIFPFNKVLVDTDAGTYLTAVLTNIRPAGSVYFKDAYLIFNIICHHSQWRLFGKVRPFAIMDELYQMFDNKKVIGIGKTEFVDAQYVSYNTSFYGYVVKYKFVDFG